MSWKVDKTSKKTAIEDLWNIHNIAVRLCAGLPLQLQTQKNQRSLDSIKGIAMSLIRRIEKGIDVEIPR